MCLAQVPQCSDTGEARTSGPSVSSQAFYHLATGLPKFFSAKVCIFSNPLVKTFILGKNHLNETVRFDTCNICLGLRNKKIIFLLRFLI